MTTSTAGTNEFAAQLETKTTLVVGNAYSAREAIKAAGGKWDGTTKTWRLDIYEARVAGGYIGLSQWAAKIAKTGATIEME